MYKYSVKIRKVSGRLNESVLPSKSLVVKSKTRKTNRQVFAEASKYFKKKYGLVIESADVINEGLWDSVKKGFGKVKNAVAGGVNKVKNAFGAKKTTFAQFPEIPDLSSAIISDKAKTVVKLRSPLGDYFAKMVDGNKKFITSSLPQALVVIKQYYTNATTQKNSVGFAKKLYSFIVETLGGLVARDFNTTNASMFKQYYNEYEKTGMLTDSVNQNSAATAISSLQQIYKTLAQFFSNEKIAAGIGISSQQIIKQVKTVFIKVIKAAKFGWGINGVITKDLNKGAKYVAKQIAYQVLSVTSTFGDEGQTGEQA